MFFSVSKNVQSNINKAEWTVLAGIVLEKEGLEIKCVALGSGTQCVGYEKVKSMEPGTVVSDCHAEVLCRRAFLGFIIEAIRVGFRPKNKQKIFLSTPEK